MKTKTQVRTSYWIAIFVSIIAVTAIAPSAHAIHGVGNGGVAVVCRSNLGTITSATLLDLFEGSAQYGLVYSTDSLDVGTKLELAQLKLIKNPKFLEQFRSTLAQVRSRWTPLPRGVGLTPTNDAFPKITQKGCDFEQVANFAEDDGKIYIDQEIFKEFSLNDQAALYVHETVYRMARVNQGDTSSVRSRKLTAHLLAQNPDVDVIIEMMKQLAKKPEPPASSDPAPAKLQPGLYIPDGYYCAYKVIQINDGRQLIITATTNPTLESQCVDEGKSEDYRWGATFKDGKKVWGFLRSCGVPNKWCALIEVLSERHFVQTGMGKPVRFGLW